MRHENTWNCDVITSSEGHAPCILLQTLLSIPQRNPHMFCWGIRTCSKSPLKKSEPHHFVSTMCLAVLLLIRLLGVISVLLECSQKTKQKNSLSAIAWGCQKNKQISCFEVISRNCPINCPPIKKLLLQLPVQI